MWTTDESPILFVESACWCGAVAAGLSSMITDLALGPVGNPNVPRERRYYRCAEAEIEAEAEAQT